MLLLLVMLLILLQGCQRWRWGEAWWEALWRCCEGGRRLQAAPKETADATRQAAKAARCGRQGPQPTHRACRSGWLLLLLVLQPRRLCRDAIKPPLGCKLLLSM